MTYMGGSIPLGSRNPPPITAKEPSKVIRIQQGFVLGCIQKIMSKPPTPAEVHYAVLELAILVARQIVQIRNAASLQSRKPCEVSGMPQSHSRHRKDVSKAAMETDHKARSWFCVAS